MCVCVCVCVWGSILCMRPANERGRYSVTPSLISWAHTQRMIPVTGLILYQNLLYMSDESIFLECLHWYLWKSQTFPKKSNLWYSWAIIYIFHWWYLLPVKSVEQGRNYEADSIPSHLYGRMRGQTDGGMDRTTGIWNHWILHQYS